MFKFGLRSVLYVLMFLLAFTAGWVSFMPMSFVAQQIQSNQPDLHITSSHGTWWHGGLQGVSWQNHHNIELLWQLDLIDDFNLQAQVEVKHAALQASTTITTPVASLWQDTLPTLNVSSSLITVDIAQLAPFAPYPLPAINGEIKVFAEQLTLDLNALQQSHAKLPMIALEPPLRFSTTNVTVLNNLALGRFTGLVRHSNNPQGYHLSLNSVQDGSEPITVEGYSLLTNQQIKSDYKVSPNPRADHGLIKLLDLMGQKQANGSYRFNTVYSI